MISREIEKLVRDTIKDKLRVAVNIGPASNDPYDQARVVRVQLLWLGSALEEPLSVISESVADF